VWSAAIRQRRLSARSATRLLRVARTIADLEDQEAVEGSHLAEALTYRSFDRIQMDEGSAMTPPD
jgi:magnesium chelatase family protein